MFRFLKLKPPRGWNAVANAAKRTSDVALLRSKLLDGGTLGFCQKQNYLLRPFDEALKEPTD